jgi:hypothetical protein
MIFNKQEKKSELNLKHLIYFYFSICLLTCIHVSYVFPIYAHTYENLYYVSICFFKTIPNPFLTDSSYYLLVWLVHVKGNGPDSSLRSFKAKTKLLIIVYVPDIYGISRPPSF